MAETNKYKLLAQGQLTGSLADIAAPAAGKQWLIGLMIFVNTDSSTRTYKLTANGTAAANQITGAAYSLGTNESDHWEFRIPLPLRGDSSDLIKGIASVTAVVTYTIWGDEVSGAD